MDDNDVVVLAGDARNRLPRGDTVKEVEGDMAPDTGGSTILAVNADHT